MILLADNEAPDQTVRMRSLIRTFAVRICMKTRFRIALPEFVSFRKGAFSEWEKTISFGGVVSPENISIPLKAYVSLETFTHLCQVDSSTLTFCTCPLTVKGVPG